METHSSLNTHMWVYLACLTVYIALRLFDQNNQNQHQEYQ